MSRASSPPRSSCGLVPTTPIPSEPRRRPSQAGRTRARLGIEALEGRCLLSGIAGVTEYAVPNYDVASQITQGPDGNLWFSSGTIGMVNPATHAITEFSLPTANAHPYGITSGPDGNVWFTEMMVNKIGMINPTTHAITEFALPSGYTLPRGITLGPVGNLWFAEWSDAVGMINPTTRAFSEFPIGHTSAPGA
jgi:virginiamycin B lyase